MVAGGGGDWRWRWRWRWRCWLAVAVAGGGNGGRWSVVAVVGGWWLPTVAGLAGGTSLDMAENA
ncbi:hypothetical protein AB0877_30110 [Micromonospora sp. NPDC047644]|uniref:hypothetical protein n=1 Tax=Micromonospora sp. NPDC047644 TaxID=3157203 RepID=UPI0034565DA9